MVQSWFTVKRLQTIEFQCNKMYARSLSHNIVGLSRSLNFNFYFPYYLLVHVLLWFLFVHWYNRMEPTILWQDRRRAKSWGMTGEESNPASLFRLYVDYGRYTEATHLLLECMESFASLVNCVGFHISNSIDQYIDKMKLSFIYLGIWKSCVFQSNPLHLLS